LVTSYYYNYENRLSRVVPPTGPAINYRYDYAGNLVERSEEEYRGERTRYVYGAGVEPLAQQEGGQWTDNVVVNGKIIETFRQSYGNNPNNKLFYHTDALGSVVALSNRAGRVVRTTEYDPWGRVLTDNFVTGPGVGGPVSVAYEFIGAYGVRRDVDGKSIMGVRTYDAGTGRFTSEDPLGFGAGDINFFRYTKNNSVNYIDPAGLKRLSYEEMVSLTASNNNSGQSNELIICLAWKESGFDPNAQQKAPNTARGLMQVTKSAAKDVGANYDNLYDPATNISAGSSYLRLRIKWAGGCVVSGLDGYGTGSGYSTSILECEKCLKGVGCGKNCFK
jgi:RHS repeat-associated protein